MDLAHLSPSFPPSRLSHALKPASASRAILWDSSKAVSQGVTLSRVAMNAALRITSGYIRVYSIAWNPPMLAPTSRSMRGTPACCLIRSSALTISLTVVFGKLK